MSRRSGPLSHSAGLRIVAHVLKLVYQDSRLTVRTRGRGFDSRVGRSAGG